MFEYIDELKRKIEESLDNVAAQANLPQIPRLPSVEDIVRLPQMLLSSIQQNIYQESVPYSEVKEVVYRESYPSGEVGEVVYKESYPAQNETKEIQESKEELESNEESEEIQPKRRRIKRIFI